MLRGLVVVIAVSLPSLAHAADKYAALGKCYESGGQIETADKGGKKVTTFKDENQVAAECTEAVIAKAKQTKSVPDLMELAGVIGKHWNWQQTMPVYTLAAKADKTKDACTGKDPLYALDLALSAPAEDDQVKEAVKFMDACWPKIKDAVAGMLKDDTNGYTKDNLCKFLDGKKALPADKKKLCAPA